MSCDYYDTTLFQWQSFVQTFDCTISSSWVWEKGNASHHLFLLLGHDYRECSRATALLDRHKQLRRRLHMQCFAAAEIEKNARMVGLRVDLNKHVVTQAMLLKNNVEVDEMFADVKLPTR